MTKLTEFYNHIDSYNNNNKTGYKTQKTAENHELYIKKALIKYFNAKEIMPDDLKTILSNNNKKLKSKPKKRSDIIVNCPEYINITNNNSINNILNNKKTFVVHQPSGAQDYPDIIIGTYLKSKLFLTYIECKQKKPTFNNNPPKENKNCIYICGNKIYNGSVLTDRKIQRKIRSYKNDLKILCANYTDDIIRFIPYNKIECKWTENGPSYPIDNELNDIFIENCLTRHLK